MKTEKNKLTLLPRKYVLLRLDPGKVNPDAKRDDTTTITTSGTTCGAVATD